jgi:Ca2+-binding RTX toxin-like protein
MFQNKEIQIIDSESFAEIIFNRTQDYSKSGYQNLGSAANTLTVSASQIGDLFINAQAGNDRVFVFGQGNHTVHAGSGDDWVAGGAGNDLFYGGSGSDTLEGGAGVDQLFGGSGTDELWGGAGADILSGGSGADLLMGDHDLSPTSQDGRDTLDGGSGDDTLVGGGNADVMFGGAGADSFRFDHIDDFVMGHSDVIRDFSRAQGDKIDLRTMDANNNLAGNQAFTLATTAAEQQTAGRFWLSAIGADGRQSVFVNVDGGATDGQIIVFFDDPAMTGLQTTDFFL